MVFGLILLQHSIGKKNGIKPLNLILELVFFASHIAPLFLIPRRVVGTYCAEKLDSHYRYPAENKE